MYSFLPVKMLYAKDEYIYPYNALGEEQEKVKVI